MEELQANDPKFSGKLGIMLRIMKLAYRDALSTHGPFTLFAVTDSGFGAAKTVSIHLNIYAESVGPFLIFLFSIQSVGLTRHLWDTYRTEYVCAYNISLIWWYTNKNIYLAKATLYIQSIYNKLLDLEHC